MPKAIEITTINSNGTEGTKRIARDADHAQRLERRIKEQAGPGNSITFRRKNI